MDDLLAAEKLFYSGHTITSSFYACVFTHDAAINMLKTYAPSVIDGVDDSLVTNTLGSSTRGTIGHTLALALRVYILASAKTIEHIRTVVLQGDIYHVS